MSGKLTRRVKRNQNLMRRRRRRRGRIILKTSRRTKRIRKSPILKP